MELELVLPRPRGRLTLDTTEVTQVTREAMHTPPAPTTALVLLLLAASVLAGCPDASRHGGRAPVAKCEQVGQVCMFAPGKLGVCAPASDCADEPCLVCQSQH